MKPAQFEAQEPVAWMFQHEETGRMNYVSNDGIHDPTMFLKMNPRYALVCPLYTTPPQRTWVGLTDEEILEVWKENEKVYPMDRSRLLDRTRACIRKAQIEVGCAECGVNGGHALYCVACAEKFVGEATTKLQQKQETIEGLNRDYDLLFAEYQLLLKKEWVGLTDEEMMDAIYVDDTPMERGRRVEAKLKQKNGYAKEKNT